jgi:hypothetical protein
LAPEADAQDAVGWIIRPQRAAAPTDGGPSLADLAGLAEELGYPLRYVAGDPDAGGDR